MKNYLQNKSKVFKSALTLIVFSLFVISMQAQCDTKITDADHDGKDYVCAESTTYYQAIRSAATGSTITWTLCGGGTIQSTNDDNIISNVSIQWDSLPGTGPYCIKMTETNGNCSNTEILDVYIEQNNLVMACNRLVLVALDNNCRDTIGADQIIEAPLYPDESYNVDIFNTDNSIRPEPIVTLQDLGDTLMVVVTHECSGLSCMGRIAFQDNLATMLSCRTDTIKLECDESTDPENPLVGFPLVAGSSVHKIDQRRYQATIPGDCGGEFTLVYSDEVLDQTCGLNDYQYIIHRTWTAIDASGNGWSCTETIAQKWGDFDTMKMPPNYDGMINCDSTGNNLFFQCNDSHPNPKESIYWPYKDSIPTPDITGYPQYASCSNIQFLYEDLIIPDCGYNRKVLRQWTILDWCTGRQKQCNQVLAFVDDTPPIIALRHDTLEFDATIDKCSGDAYPLPDPVVLEDCSDVKVEVIGYKLCSQTFDRTDGIYKKAGKYGIKDLPVDSVFCVRYKATDECGLWSVANMRVVIRDRQKPTAACDAHTVVTVGVNAKLYATALDNHSWDNCGISKLEIKRTSNKCGNSQDLIYGESVDMCCADVGTDVIVKLKAYDIHGLTSECTGIVHVQDKERPVLTYCPKNFTVDCEQDYSNYFPGGKPTATDNCTILPPTKTDRANLNDCGFGTVRRTWVLKDKAGLETLQKCVQIITVEDKHPLTEANINWPTNKTLYGCWPEIDYSENVTGLPTINNTTCKQLGIAHDDKIIHNPTTSNACVIIERKFTVGDWCNPNAPYITHLQYIYIHDGGAPYFTYCKHDTTISSGTACSVNTTISAEAEDDCTPTSDLVYTYTVDLDNDGTIDFTGNGNIINRTFDSGRHKIVFTVTDGCDNTATCTRYINIKDTKPPTPLCLRKITTTLGINGTTTVDAKIFDHGSIDNCTPNNYGTCGCKTDLRFSFSQNVNDKTRTYTCDSLDNGVGKKFDLDVWVTDLDGNKDFCKVILNIMDSQNVCPDAPNPTVVVTGTIVDANLNGIEGFKVNGMTLNQEVEDFTETNVDGQYYLDGLGAYKKYVVAPIKNDNVLDGVTTLDIVQIQKHLLGIDKFHDPYSYIAADANESKSVSASDILQLRKLILGITTELPGKKSWKFIQAKTEFNNPAHPWDYDDKYITDSLFFEQDSLDFIAIKLGDINHSAQGYNSNSVIEIRSEDKYFETKNISFNKSDIVPVVFKPEESDFISGFQFTLEYDKNVLELLSIENGKIALQKSNYYIVNNKDGIITFSWNSANAISLDEMEKLFTINFKAKSDGILSENLKISSKITTSELYSENLEVSKLELRFEGNNIESNEIVINQNTPNPFSNNTEIVINLPEETDLDFRIMDSTGKIIKSTHRHYSKGQNSITVLSSELGKPGLYFYEITTEKYSTVKRMVYIK